MTYYQIVMLVKNARTIVKTHTHSHTDIVLRCGAVQIYRMRIHFIENTNKTSSIELNWMHRNTSHRFRMEVKSTGICSSCFSLSVFTLLLLLQYLFSIFMFFVHFDWNISHCLRLVVSRTLHLHLSLAIKPAFPSPFAMCNCCCI